MGEIRLSCQITGQFKADPEDQVVLRYSYTRKTPKGQKKLPGRGGPGTALSEGLHLWWLVLRVTSVQSLLPGSAACNLQANITKSGFSAGTAPAGGFSRCISKAEDFQQWPS